MKRNEKALMFGLLWFIVANTADLIITTVIGFVFAIICFLFSIAFSVIGD